MPSVYDSDLGSALVEAGAIDEVAARRAAAAGAETRTGLAASLLQLGLVEEEALYETLAMLGGLRLISIGEIEDRLPVELGLSAEFLRRAMVVPAWQETDAITVAVSALDNGAALEGIAFHLGREVRVVLATPSTIRAALDRLDGPAAEALHGAAETDVEKLRALANDGPIIGLVNDLVAAAVQVSASDIHIEAMEAQGRVRYRVDGGLRTRRRLSDHEHAAVTSRLKVMAHLNISEKRRPQDGRAQVVVRGNAVDLRVSTLPTQFGESVVLRILDRRQVALDWTALGFEEARVRRIERIVNAPNGIFLVAGPTGSGKTTTLYTAISRINSEDRKIITVEDPIEYALAGVNQVAVAPEIEMGFARALRAILRQDPDVIMVGEIRDQETAEIAVRAALVGRMVLSTVHTNDSLAAVDRLLDLGVPPYLLSATLRGVLSQRLVQKNCTACGGRGCASCDGSGIRGRTVVSELLEITPELAGGIARGHSSQALREAAAASGFVTMERHASDLMARGVLSEENVARSLGF
ncbi:GspE/PulE family protein [Defluviimonas salinarum]|uniref:ATPase, T2SS/T4P/T4SS family n=1 Tax=Defluviimonas salinarum TaxID=2992147 RepID=A0ABT3J768_9RHOB|nr:type II/IV secretion system protein [Defluviimonas salinarum]MCW3783545.1 ATPase, T2SS/T4P/T4SS family [Defluviimonas salinarum]